MSQCIVYFIRHGMSTSNEKGLLCGSTDSLVSKQGREELENLKQSYSYPEIDHLYVSPAIRCRETASILFPGMEPELVENLWEYHFGVMENQPAAHLASMPNYQQWLNQTPDFGFEGGETLLETQMRALAGMTHVVSEIRRHGYQKIAIIAHGELFFLLFQAALMSDLPPKTFLLCPNGMGLTASVDTDSWFQNQKMQFLDFFPANAPRLKPEDTPYFRSEPPEQDS